LRLYTMTHNESFFQVAYNIANGLIAHKQGDTAQGYYWIAGYLMYRTSTSEYLENITSLTERYYGLTGVAGVLKFMISMYDHTGNTTYLDVAKHVGKYLVNNQFNGAWPNTFDTNQQNIRYYTGLVYGAAGIADVLLELYLRTGNETFLNSVKSAADFLIARGESASIFNNATRWPIRYSWTGSAFSVDLNPGYTNNTGYGTAGVGMFFAKLYKHTGNLTYLATARKAANYLIQVANRNESGCWWVSLWKGLSESGFTSDVWNGYYSGIAGIGDFLLQIHALVRESCDTALSGADSLVSNQNNDGSWYVAGSSGAIYYGIKSGVAGIGLAVLEAYERTLNKTYLASAEKAANFLINVATVVLDECSWSMSSTSNDHYVGWDYGVSGIAYFLYRVFERTGNETYLNYVKRALKWLSTHYRGNNLAHYWMEYYTGGLNTSASGVAYCGISNGTAGVVMLLNYLAPRLLNESLLVNNWISPLLQHRYYSSYNIDYFDYKDESIAFRELNLSTALLIQNATSEGNGYSWPLNTETVTKYMGYMHGVTGIGSVLVESQSIQEYQAWYTSDLYADLRRRYYGLGGLQWAAGYSGITDSDSTIYYGMEFGLAGKVIGYAHALRYSIGNTTIAGYIKSTADLLLNGYDSGKFVLSSTNNTAYNGLYNGSAGIILALEYATMITRNTTYHNTALLSAKYLIANKNNWTVSNMTTTIENTLSRGIAGIVTGLLSVYDLYVPKVENITFFVYNTTSGEVSNSLNDVMYYSRVWVSLDIEDNESGIYSAVLYYKIGDYNWVARMPTSINGATYNFSIANHTALEWNKLCQFTVLVYDYSMKCVYTTTYTYIVGDDICPQIYSITNYTEVNTSTAAHIRISVVDDGSGIHVVRLYYWDVNVPSDIRIATMSYEYGTYYGVDIPPYWNTFNRTTVYLVSVVDNAGNEINTTQYQYIVVDRIPPSVVHIELPQRIYVGVTATISIRVRDEGGSNVKTVIFSYIDPITQEWHNITMEFVGSDEWRVILPPFQSEFAISIKFYIIDNAGNVYVTDTFSIAVVTPATMDLTPVILAVVIVAMVVITSYVVIKKRREAIKQPPAPTPAYQPKYKPRVYKPRVATEKTMKPPEKEIEEMTKGTPAMVICPHCHAVIPSTADKCPKCGKSTFVSLK
ncbi:MAG: lanthionine synthetase LanC family protein, partial [Candidatus Korarchaeota archaeon]